VCFVSVLHCALLFVVLATSLFGCCPFYFGGSYSSWRWFTYNLYRESYLGVKQSSNADFRSGWSCNSAGPLCRQGVLLGDLYPGSAPLLAVGLVMRAACLVLRLVMSKCYVELDVCYCVCVCVCVRAWRWQA
jgi:hypothetical protein